MRKSIRIKVLAVLLSLIVLYGFIAILNLLYNKKINKINHFNSTVKTVQVHLLKDAITINDFFIYDANNDLFYHTNYSTYLEEHRMYMSTIKNEINTLLNSPVINEFGIFHELNEVNTIIGQYQEDFNTIINTLQQNHKNELPAGNLITEELTGLKSELDNKKNTILSEISQITDDTINRRMHLANQMKRAFELTAFVILIAGILLSIIISKRTTNRIIMLSDTISAFVKSKFTDMEPLTIRKRKDEIGKLADNFLILRKEVWNQINFLEDNIVKRTRQIQAQNEHIKEQNEEILAQRDEVLIKSEIIEKQNKSILDSIVYAKKIQEAFLPNKNTIMDVFPDSFIIWKPKAVVSGDFYWFKHIEEEEISVLALVDCTGHGVPGAFMSMLGNALLNEIILRKNNYQADKILNLLRERLLETLQTEGCIDKSNDGMDMALLIFDHKKEVIEFAGAKRPLYIIRNNDLEHIPGDKIPIGLDIKGNRPFTSNILKIDSSDSIYIFSDGFVDQFGEQSRQKFRSKYFKDMLLNHSSKPMKLQGEIYNSIFEEWKGNLEQTDDVLLIGLRPPFGKVIDLHFKHQAAISN
ncbi:MAG: SpoIIE family protein phosphatase [Bacteroidales bacterium]|nr:SpoIIE family protein phosphatase [Bacteroidales bacterium]